MKIKALTSFAGIITMHKGQEMECDNKEIVQDLTACGYVEVVKERKAEQKKTGSGDTDEGEPDTTA